MLIVSTMLLCQLIDDASSLETALMITAQIVLQLGILNCIKNISHIYCHRVKETSNNSK